ncbi:MAG TPA: hypothetical protein VL131_12525 [Gammaproteobacteria bacterium]|nr:hypothetical protein [Gammaproteobacteria bacterium]
MDYLLYVAMRQILVWAVFSILVVGGALAQRRWGLFASIVVLVLSWPIFLGTALLNELRDIPQLLELNPFGLVLRMLWVYVTLDTVALAVALWFVHRASSVRGAIVRGVASAAAWAFVMPVPLTVVGLMLMAVIPAGKADYYYIDFRPMGLEVLETGKPPFRHYTGGPIPLRYRAELDGREIEVRIRPEESLLVMLDIRAVTPGSPALAVESIRPPRCGHSYVVDRDSSIHFELSQPGAYGSNCYGAVAPGAEITLHFVGGAGSLTLTGPITKGGEYYFYDSL